MAKSKEPSERDVVCGLPLNGMPGLAEATYRGKRHVFCSAFCANRFKKSPSRFLGTPLVRLTDVWKVFDTGGVETQVLRGLNLHIWNGDFVVIIGASGSGKSTALNMIGLLDRPSKGQVTVDGKDASTFSEQERARLRSRMFGFIFQQYNLIPWLTAYENVTLPLIFAELPVDRAAIEAEFAGVGLRERMHHRPHELSGGEQQRTALMRALATNPRIILGDEPTGNLDSVTGARILDRLVDLHKREHRTLVIVSHDAGIADLADQIILIKDGMHIRDHFASRPLRR